MIALSAMPGLFSRDRGRQAGLLESPGTWHRLQQLMRTDPLTGLANRRFFNETLITHISLAQRHGVPLSLVISDLDHFKSINDTYGLTVGDTVLQGFAEILKRNARMEDLAARYGGEEFIVLLPHTDKEGARFYAERVRQDLQSRVFTEISGPVTASFGVSQLTFEDDADTFVRRVDQAVYRAKDNGRNQVAVA
ncbi:MAG TPA: GGDEF domain-containing protein [Desulfobacterales bacterium]|nr:GGDEF domain-containing protein [Desulfobacterales bacterium]